MAATVAVELKDVATLDVLAIVAIVAIVAVVLIEVVVAVVLIEVVATLEVTVASTQMAAWCCLMHE